MRIIEILSHIMYSFTRSVADHYSPEDSEFMAESSDYVPLQSTGLEWNHQPVDELIYQEYSHSDNGFTIRVLDACSPEKNEEIPEDQQDEDRAMAWKRLRPSSLRTVRKSMYFGALISILTAMVIGSLYCLISYVSFQTMFNCQFHQKKSIPVKIQWMRTLSDAASCGFIYMWFLVNIFFLFRPHQLQGLRRKLIFGTFMLYCLDALYRVILQSSGISHSRLTKIQMIPLIVLFLVSLCWQGYQLWNRFQVLSRGRINFFVQIAAPGFFTFLIGIVTVYFTYPMYNEENENRKLLIAIFAPLSGLLLKVIVRICIQSSWNITHPGYTYILFVPLYFGSAILFRVMQAELENISAITILGIIHGAAEVLERSTMVVIDHICHVVLKRRAISWGSFRTPRRERLMADIAIISMLYESTAIVSVNGVLYLHKFIYLKENSLSTLFQRFLVASSVQLVIEWFFNSISLAIETYHQNIAVMAVWQRKWKRHVLVAVINVIPLALCSTLPIIQFMHGQLAKSRTDQPCKMPFS